MAFKKFRKMKVYDSSGYNYKSTPSIILKGDWLKDNESFRFFMAILFIGS